MAEASGAIRPVLAEPSTWVAAIEAWLSESTTLLDLAGFSPGDAEPLSRFQRLMMETAADRPLGPIDASGSSFDGPISFRAAGFVDKAVFAGTVFGGPADFTSCAFARIADFSDTEFHHIATFSRCRFSSEASFARSTFDAARLDGAHFDGLANFTDATFRGEVTFVETAFNGHAQFFDASFRRRADFGQSTFAAVANFVGSTFGEDVRFRGARFDVGDFRGTRFTERPDFSNVTIDGSLHGTPNRLLTNDDDHTEAGPPIPSPTLWTALAAIVGVGLLGMRFGGFHPRAIDTYLAGVAAATVAAACWAVVRRLTRVSERGDRVSLFADRRTRLLRPAASVLATMATGLAAGAVLLGVMFDLRDRAVNRGAEMVDGVDGATTNDSGNDGSGGGQSGSGQSSSFRTGDGDSAAFCDTTECLPAGVQVDLGGVWLVNPFSPVDDATTNDSGRSLLTSVIDAIAQPAWIGQLRQIFSTATEAGGNLVTDNIDSILQNVVKPGIEGLFDLGGPAGDTGNAELGTDSLTEILRLIQEHGELGDLSEAEQIALAIAIQQGLAEHAVLSDAFVGSAATNSTTVIVINEGHGSTHTKRNDG